MQPIIIVFLFSMMLQYKSGISSYQYRNSHYKDKMFSWPSYLYNEISKSGKNVIIKHSTRHSENDSLLRQLTSENANIGQAWKSYIVICSMAHCIMSTNFRPFYDCHTESSALRPGLSLPYSPAILEFSQDFNYEHRLQTVDWVPWTHWGP